MLSMFPKLAAVRASIEIPASGKQASGTDGALTMHLAAPEGSIGGYCIVCGDPDRVPKIGSMLTDGKQVANRRGYCVWTGTLDGARVSVCSHGIGSASAAIVFEELARHGVHTIIRMGTCGSTHKSVASGDVVISNACVRDEGTSRAYVPLEIPLTATPAVVAALLQSYTLAQTLDSAVAGKMGIASSCKMHVGTTHCKDSFYSELPGHTSDEDATRRKWLAYERCRVIATEMEASALYTVAMLRGLRAGVVLAVIGSTHDQQTGGGAVHSGKSGMDTAPGSDEGKGSLQEQPPSFLASPELAASTKATAIETAVGAIRLLIAHDGEEEQAGESEAKGGAVQEDNEAGGGGGEGGGQ